MRLGVHTRRRFAWVLLALPLFVGLDAPAALAQPDDPERRREAWRERFLEATPAERERMRGEARDRIRDGVRDRVRDRLKELPAEERRELRRRWQQASPAERETLRREILQRTLSEQERVRLREFTERARGPVPREELMALGWDLGGLAPEERRNLRKRIRDLPRDERRALLDRLSHYRALPADEQQALRDQLSRMRAMDADARKRLDENARRFREMPDGEKQRMRDAWRRIQEMPEDEREALLRKLLEE